MLGGALGILPRVGGSHGLWGPARPGSSGQAFCAEARPGALSLRTACRPLVAACFHSQEMISKQISPSVLVLFVFNSPGLETFFLLNIISPFQTAFQPRVLVGPLTVASCRQSDRMDWDPGIVCLADVLSHGGAQAYRASAGQGPALLLSGDVVLPRCLASCDPRGPCSWSV